MLSMQGDESVLPRGSFRVIFFFLCIWKDLCTEKNTNKKIRSKILKGDLLMKFPKLGFYSLL